MKLLKLNCAHLRLLRICTVMIFGSCVETLNRIEQAKRSPSVATFDNLLQINDRNIARQKN